ncbi:ABC transporter substrate-binding protein [Aureimonas flava]|uniref:ABC transporter substrate-binding protein n=1 Tax=Aureimonas flava TaxID=2320271 RepID=A0A3A1WJI7_9HYPH|nr:CmpA/NrtA family ABC transporter substrate-binding protein [Aureimonas flava]RIY00039.1 ABC transporter substrate-binding protein [Aureimonas flava]
MSARGAADARVVRAGFIPLLDAAVLIAAAALGLDRREGIRLELTRDVSWSNIRDRLAFRQFDVAHMLGPMAVAGELGLGSNPHPVIAPFALAEGGNAITLSVELVARMREAMGDAPYPDTAAAHATALAREVARRRAANEPPPVFGVTYPFSSHNYEFRLWMAQAGIDPDRDVTLTVVPPPMTADALRARLIDGFCVNAPWNVLAVEEGIGRIVAVKLDVWPGSPEKVLGLRPDWWRENRDTAERLLAVLDAGARWCAAPENRRELAAILAEPAHVGGQAGLFEPILNGDLLVDPDGTRRAIPTYLDFRPDGANLPRRSQALWIYAQMVRWGQTPFDADAAERAAEAFRPDVYRAALPGRADALPDARIERAPPGGGPDFDPERIEAYLSAAPMGGGGSPAGD